MAATLHCVQPVEEIVPLRNVAGVPLYAVYVVSKPASAMRFDADGDGDACGAADGDGDGDGLGGTTPPV